MESLLHFSGCKMSYKTAGAEISDNPEATMNRPAPVELCHKNMRFLITHNPTDSTLNSFIEVNAKFSPPPSFSFNSKKERGNLLKNSHDCFCM